ncbi:hypothetical protein AB1N83_014141 [Pleurotus pulmonarius]
MMQHREPLPRSCSMTTPLLICRPLPPKSPLRLTRRRLLRR